MRLLTRLAVFAVAAAAVTLIATTALRADPKPEPKPDDQRIEVKVTPEMIRHSRINNWIYFGGFVYGLGVLLLILGTRGSAKMRDLSLRVTKRPFLASLVYFLLFSVALTVLEFPLAYYADFVVPHQFALTDQTFGAWMLDGLKAFAVNCAIGAPIVALALLAISKVRRWWLALWLGSIPVMILLVVIAPVFIDPLFNKFEPLKDQVLRQKLLDLASRAGIEGGRVYQVDKSKQTKVMNAYVTGIGPTKRIVMWDTLLAKMTPDEVLAVMGHEMGHYALNHLWKGLAAGIAISLVVCFTLQRAYEAGVRRWGSDWRIVRSGDPASLPWLMLIVSVTLFLLSPVTSGISRYTEHESDVFSLELTHLNEPMATAMVKLSEDSKTIPQPHPFIEFWRYSHPPIAKRVAFALSYHPWKEGKPNQAWKP
jgi:STE24 endopeptidase